MRSGLNTAATCGKERQDGWNHTCITQKRAEENDGRPRDRQHVCLFAGAGVKNGLRMAVSPCTCLYSLQLLDRSIKSARKAQSPNPRTHAHHRHASAAAEEGAFGPVPTDPLVQLPLPALQAHRSAVCGEWTQRGFRTAREVCVAYVNYGLYLLSDATTCTTPASMTCTF
jgi:hypothetical protein